MKKYLPVNKCKVAGKTLDGKVCYYGKKDSADPDEEDLTLWVTLGRPRVDGNNYVRLSQVGYDEAEHYRRVSDVPFGEWEEWRERRVLDLLAGVHSSKLRAEAAREAKR